METTELTRVAETVLQAVDIRSIKPLRKVAAESVLEGFATARGELERVEIKCAARDSGGFLVRIAGDDGVSVVGVSPNSVRSAFWMAAARWEDCHT
jgi:hypothetical protein